MMEKIRWVQRAAGREIGHEETVETDTDFMRGCLENGRIEILGSAAPAEDEAPPRRPR